jgi:hypothetical protein
MEKEHLLEIYKVEAEKYNKTRDIHWKMNIALWSLIVLTIYAKLEGKFPSPRFPLCMQSLIFGLFAILNIAFIWLIHNSMDNSLRRMRKMAVHIVEHNGGQLKWQDLHKKEGWEGWSTASFYWRLFQIGTTLLLIAVLLLI